MSQPTLSIFTGGKGLGRIYKEQVELMVKFTEFNLALTSSQGKLNLNLLGKTRVIMLQGMHDGVGFDGATPNAKLGDFIFEMEAWVNSAIQVSKTYTDSFSTAYYVNCFDWTWTRSNTDPNRIAYTLLFKETGTNIFS